MSTYFDLSRILYAGLLLMMGVFSLCSCTATCSQIKYLDPSSTLGHYEPEEQATEAASNRAPTERQNNQIK